MNKQSTHKEAEADNEALLLDENAANDVVSITKSKTKTSKTQNKWSWSAEHIEKLLDYIKEFNTQCK